MTTFKVNDCVESLETGNRGVLQGSYPNGKFILFYKKGYEHLLPEQMKHIEPSEVPFRVDLYQVQAQKKADEG